MRLLIAKLASTSLRSVSFALSADGDIAELATDLDSCVRLLRASEYDLLVLMVSEGATRAGDVIAHIRREVGRVPMVVLTEPEERPSGDPAPATVAALVPREPARILARGPFDAPPIIMEPDDFNRHQPSPMPWVWAASPAGPDGPQSVSSRRRTREDPTHPPRLGSLRGSFAFDDVADGLRVDGQPVPLSHAEQRIFAALWQARGAVVGTDELLDAVYGDNEKPVSRVLPVFVFKLRKKLAGLGVGEAIETEMGRGFRLRADAVPLEPGDDVPPA